MKYIYKINPSILNTFIKFKNKKDSIKYKNIKYVIGISLVFICEFLVAYIKIKIENFYENQKLFTV